MSEPKYIRFVEGPPAKKTRRWTVAGKDGQELLGVVCWYGGWRCYAFYPHLDTVFEKQCLRDIAGFCEAQTKAHRAKVTI